MRVSFVGAALTIALLVAAATTGIDAPGEAAHGSSATVRSKLVVKPSVAAPGTRLTATGRLFGEPRQPVELQRRRPTGRYVRVATGRTGDDGTFRLSTRVPACRPTVVLRVRTVDGTQITRPASVGVTGITRISAAGFAGTYDLVMSGDGQVVAYTDRGQGNPGVLWRRRSDSFEPAPWLGELPDMSADGRFVAFTRFVGDEPMLFVQDVETGAASTWDSGFWASISADGRYVAYRAEDVVLRDRARGSTTTIATGDRPTVSADGRYVAFQSWVADLVPDDVNGKRDIFVWDRISGLLTQVTAGNGHSAVAQISGDGRFVTFQSEATDLVPGDVNGKTDVFLWDRYSRLITRVSVGNGRSRSPSISDDGRYVAYDSKATDIEPPDPNTGRDVFIWDRVTASTTRVTSGDRESAYPLISGDGRYLVFISQANDLVPGDKPGTWDVFAWDRGDAAQ